jgi:hypothetical protein
MAFTQITVTGNYGTGVTGQVTFTLTQPMSNGGQMLVPTPIQATVTNGTFSVTLPANDDAATVPQGVSWGVTEVLSTGQPADYFITVPSAAPGGTVDISTLRPGGVGWA